MVIPLEHHDRTVLKTGAQPQGLEKDVQQELRCTTPALEKGVHIKEDRRRRVQISGRVLMHLREAC